MFIYVMDNESKEKMLKLGFQLLQNKGNIWVFANKDNCKFESLDVPHVLSDTLTF